MKTYKLIIGGDILSFKKANEALFCEGDGEKLYGEKILSLFHSADYSLVNLEGVLSDTKERQDKPGSNIIRSPKIINGIKPLGVNAVTLANNHITDANDTGCKDTISVLEENGIQWVGVGTTNKMKDNLSFTLGDARICIYNVSEIFWNAPSETTMGANVYDEYVVCNRLRELKRKHDIVIVVFHGGAERFCYSTPVNRRQCHRMAESGADVILVQHTHCIGCEEIYNDSYILYGQGNFIFRNARQSFELEPTLHGLLIELDIQGKQYSVKKHAISVDPKDYTARYDDVQNFSELDARSEKNKDEKWVNEEFKRSKEKKTLEYLLALKTNYRLWKISYRYLPSFTTKLLMLTYSHSQLLLLKYLLIGARPNESMCEALDVLLEKIK